MNAASVTTTTADISAKAGQALNGAASVAAHAGQSLVDAAAAANHLVRPLAFDTFTQAARIVPLTPEQAQSAEDARRASRFVSAFKVIGGGLGSGLVLSMLFGSPPVIAIGLSFAIGLAQHFMAERLFKSRNPASQRIVKWCGMLVPQKSGKGPNALTPEDRANASVWGAVTAATTLVEGLANLALARREKSAEAIKAALHANVEKASRLKFLYKAQLQGFLFKEKVVGYLTGLATKPAFMQKLMAKGANAGESATAKFMLRYKKPLILLGLLPLSWVSGYLQGITASKLAKHTVANKPSPAASSFR